MKRREDRYDPEAEARLVAEARRQRDRDLSPAERLARLHRLCASLAASARIHR
jgi:hypothetical protein